MSVVSISAASDAGCCLATVISALISSLINISGALGSSTRVSAAKSHQQNQNCLLVHYTFIKHYNYRKAMSTEWQTARSRRNGPWKLSESETEKMSPSLPSFSSFLPFYPSLLVPSPSIPFISFISLRSTPLNPVVESGERCKQWNWVGQNAAKFRGPETVPCGHLAWRLFLVLCWESRS